jgi:hypothetical protein
VSAFKLQEAEEPESRRLSQITLPAAYHDLYRWKLRQEDGCEEFPDVYSSLRLLGAFGPPVVPLPTARTDSSRSEADAGRLIPS